MAEPGSLAPLLQSSIQAGQAPGYRLYTAPGRSPPGTRPGPILPQAQMSALAPERIRLFRGQILNRPTSSEPTGARIEVSSLSDIAGHGRYVAGDEDTPFGEQFEQADIPIPTAVPARFHIHAQNGRRLFPSEKPTSREEVEQLERVYDTLLAEAADDLQKQLEARDLVMSEIARQVQPHCAERSELLLRLRALYYEHTSEALPLVSRVEAVERALEEKREQLIAMQRDHTALTASRNRLDASARGMTTRRVFKAIIAEEVASKVASGIARAGEVRKRIGRGEEGGEGKCAAWST
jgi:hypothetical protein